MRIKSRYLIGEKKMENGDKKKILKAVRKNMASSQRNNLMTTTSNLKSHSLENNTKMFSKYTKKQSHPRILHSVKYLFKNENEINIFSDKVNLRIFCFATIYTFMVKKIL